MSGKYYCLDGPGTYLEIKADNAAIAARVASAARGSISSTVTLGKPENRVPSVVRISEGYYDYVVQEARLSTREDSMKIFVVNDKGVVSEIQLSHETFKAMIAFYLEL